MSKYIPRVNPLRHIAEDRYLECELKAMVEWCQTLTYQDDVSILRPLLRQRYEYVMQRQIVSTTPIHRLQH